MKLRLHEDSIRLRLTQSEVAALVQGGEVQHTCPTAPAPLVTILQSNSQASAITAAHDGSRLLIQVPSPLLAGWDADSRVGFAQSHGPLQILIEKDFRCAHPSDPAENKDCYPNPQLSD